MVNIPVKKVYNSYIIETYNYDSIKKSIKEFAIANGLERRLVETENHPDILYIVNMPFGLNSEAFSNND